MSCAGCHVPAAGFVDTRSPHQQISLGAQWTLRRTPTLLEVAFAPLYNWDGRRDAIWNQAIGVMESNREFNSGRLFVAEQIFRLHRAEYEALFGAMPPLDDAARFPPLAPETAGCVEVTTQQGSTFAAAAAGRRRRLRRHGAGRSDAGHDGGRQRHQGDRRLRAPAALRRRPLRSLARRRRRRRSTAASSAAPRCSSGRAGCVTCHGGPRLTDGAFHNVGLARPSSRSRFRTSTIAAPRPASPRRSTDPLSTAGAFSDGDRHALPAVAGPELEGAFRTPTLRCAASHPSFMHTGAAQRRSTRWSRSSIAAAIAPAAIPGTSELTPLGLSERERADLVAFLGALDGPGPAPALLAAP